MERRTRLWRVALELVTLAVLAVLFLRVDEGGDQVSRRAGDGELVAERAQRTGMDDREGQRLAAAHGGPRPSSGLIRGQVVHAGSRAPLAGAEVCSLQELDAARSCGRTGPGGRFALDVPFGAHRLVLASEEVTLVGCARDEALTRVEVTVDRPVHERTLPVIGAAQVIEGIVFDRHGGVVEGALVEPRPAAALDEPLAFEACSLAATDEDGRFRLAVPAGLYALRAASSGYGVGFLDDARPGSLAEIILAPEARVRGQVLRRGDARPVAGAEVRVLREVGAGWQLLARIESDDGGRFALGGLPAGRLRAEASAEGLYGPGEVIEAEPEREARVDVHLAPGADLRAEVVIGEDHRPCPMGQVEIEHEALGLRFGASVDAEGIARIAGVPTGSYRARVHCLSLAPISGPERLTLAASSRATWSFGGGGSLRGRVRREGSDAPAAGVRVVLLGEGPGQRRPATVITDADGEFFVDGVAPGVVEVIAAADALGGDATVEIEEGREARVELRAPVRASIAGHARDRLGSPCQGLEVRAERASGAFVSARVDAGGRFILAGLEPGEVLVGLAEDASEAVSVVLRGDGREEIALVCADHQAQLRGRAVDDAGEPLAGALVEATPLGPGDLPRYERTSRGVLTAEDGAFTIPGLPDGRTLVTLRAAGGHELGSGVASTDAPALVHARARGVILGSLRQGVGELALPVAVEVRREDDAITRRVLVDAIAYPWRVDGLPPGRYRVEARAASGWSGAARINLAGDEPVRVDMVLGTSP